MEQQRSRLLKRVRAVEPANDRLIDVMLAHMGGAQ